MMVRVEVSRVDTEVLMEGEQSLVLVASSSSEATCFCVATCQVNAPTRTSPKPRESRYSFAKYHMAAIQPLAQ